MTALVLEATRCFIIIMSYHAGQYIAPKKAAKAKNEKLKKVS